MIPIDGARRLLHDALDAGSIPVGWLIRVDLFDSARYDWEAAGHLRTDVSHPATLFGLPYDLGWPPLRPGYELRFCPVRSCTDEQLQMALTYLPDGSVEAARTAAEIARRAA